MCRVPSVLAILMVWVLLTSQSSLRAQEVLETPIQSQTGQPDASPTSPTTTIPTTSPLDTILDETNASEESQVQPAESISINPITQPDWSQLVPTLISEGISAFLFGVLVSLSLYFGIDKRLQRKDEIRAYRILDVVLRRTITRLDYVDTWRKNVGLSSEAMEEGLRPKEMDTWWLNPIPERLKVSALKMWEEWQKSDVILQQFDADFLISIRSVLLEADQVFEILNRMQVTGNALEALRFIVFAQQEALNNLIPIFTKTRKKLGDRTPNLQNLREQMQQELIEFDTKAASLAKLMSSQDRAKPQPPRQSGFEDIQIIGIDINKCRFPVPVDSSVDSDESELSSNKCSFVLSLSARPPAGWGDTTKDAFGPSFGRRSRERIVHIPDSNDDETTDGNSTERYYKSQYKPGLKAKIAGKYLILETTLEDFKEIFLRLERAVSNHNTAYHSRLKSQEEAEQRDRELREMSLTEKKEHEEGLRQEIVIRATELGLKVFEGKPNYPEVETIIDNSHM